MRKLKAWLYAWISAHYMDGCSNYNSLKVRKSCRTKEQGREVFAKHDIPHAKGRVFIWPWHAVNFVRQYGFPVVIKPNVSGYSRGSYFPINNFKELYQAIFWAKAWWPTTIIEQYLVGKNYRVLCGRQELISVIQRYPPFVIGNGIDNIDKLILAENKIRQERKLHPVIYPLNKSDKIITHLKKGGFTLHSVPDKGQYIELFHRVALAPGGVIQTINQDIISDENKALFKKVVAIFGANVLGIDVIFEKGIQHSYKNQKCIFIEVNSRPYIAMHHYPRYGEKEDFSAALAKLDQLEINDKDIF